VWSCGATSVGERCEVCRTREAPPEHGDGNRGGEHGNSTPYRTPRGEPKNATYLPGRDLCLVTLVRLWLCAAVAAGTLDARPRARSSFRLSPLPFARGSSLTLCTLRHSECARTLCAALRVLYANDRALRLTGHLVRGEIAVALPLEPPHMRRARQARRADG
jgi:hypothetical protein